MWMFSQPLAWTVRARDLDFPQVPIARHGRTGGLKYKYARIYSGLAVVTEYTAPGWSWRAALEALRARAEPVPLIVCPATRIPAC